jgi:hypothetical protein
MSSENIMLQQTVTIQHKKFYSRQLWRATLVIIILLFMQYSIVNS